MGVVKVLALRRDYAKKIDPCRMLVWLGRRTVQNMAVRYELGRSCSNSNLLRPRVIGMGLEKGLGGSGERVLMGPEIVLGWVRRKAWDGFGERVGMGPKKGLL